MKAKFEFYDLEDDTTGELLIQVRDNIECVVLGNIRLRIIGGYGSNNFEVMDWIPSNEIYKHSIYKNQDTDENGVITVSKEVNLELVRRFSEAVIEKLELIS